MKAQGPEGAKPVVLVLVGAFLFFKSVFQKITILEYQRGILFKKGKFVKVLEPGVYRFWPWSDRVEIKEDRILLVDVKNQEVLSKDGVSIKFSVTFQYKTEDFYKAFCTNFDPAKSLYSQVQLCLREVVSNTMIDDIVESRSSLIERIRPEVEKCAAEIGLKIMNFGIKDMLFPRGLKEIFAQSVKARKEGQASLERARNEQAALRSLANAAHMIKDNAELLNLRKIQAIESSRSVIHEL